MTTVLAARPADFEWIERRTGCLRTRAFKAIKAVDDFGDILGMVVFDIFTRTSCQMHMAGRSAIAVRRLVRPAFEYAFRQLGLRVVLGVLAASNRPAVALVDGLGFRETHRVRDGYADGVDLLHFELHADECRWLSAPLAQGEAHAE